MLREPSTFTCTTESSSIREEWCWWPLIKSFTLSKVMYVESIGSRISDGEWILCCSTAATAVVLGSTLGWLSLCCAGHPEKGPHCRDQNDCGSCLFAATSIDDVDSIISLHLLDGDCSLLFDDEPPSSYSADVCCVPTAMARFRFLVPMSWYTSIFYNTDGRNRLNCDRLIIIRILYHPSIDQRKNE